MFDDEQIEMIIASKAGKPTSQKSGIHSMIITREQLMEATAAHYGYEYGDWETLREERKDELARQMEEGLQPLGIRVRD